MRRPFITTLVLATAALMAAAGCSGTSNDAGSQGDEQKLTTLKVGLIPIVDVAPIYVGVKQGFFAEEGLDLKPQFAAGGAAIVPAVVSGSFEIGYSNTVSLITAAAKGIPLRIIAPGSAVGATQDEDHCFVYAKGSSPITKTADLAGKTIAVNTVKNLGDITIKAALEAEGVDPDSVKFVEVPFPDMTAALDAGRVDAAWPCEPFVAQADEAGDTRIVGSLAATKENLQFSGYFVSQDYAAKNPKLVEAFSRAVIKATKYSLDHPDEVRAVITDYAKVPTETANKMILPVWPTDLDQSSIAKLSELSLKYGVIDAEPDLNKLTNG